MFAGKTEALIERAIQLPTGDRKVYKPTTDVRQGDGYILSHGGISISAEWIDPGLERLAAASHVFVDEAQFLTAPAVEKVLGLLRKGKNVVLGGLDLDANGHPFGHMPEFLSLADEVVKLQGTCASCGRPSSRTRCKGGLRQTILVGGAETYEPMCRPCFEKA
jgi:thymidine kinase